MTLALASACALGAMAFLVFFEVDLHCTQTTSFPIAVLDPEPHLEEAASAGFLPAYDAPSALPLRTLLALHSLCFLLWPSVALALTALGRDGRGALIRASLALWPVALAVAALRPIVGERFQAFYLAALLVAVPLFAAAALGLRFVRPNPPPLRSAWESS